MSALTQLKPTATAPESSRDFRAAPASAPENREPSGCMVKEYMAASAPSSSAAHRMASASC